MQLQELRPPSNRGRSDQRNQQNRMPDRVLANHRGVQAIDLVFPEPAEYCTRYLLPAPSARTASYNFCVTTSCWNRGKMTLVMFFFWSRWAASQTKSSLPDEEKSLPCPSRER